MFDMFVCGSSNFDQVDEISTPHSSPPKRSRRVCNCKTTNKNAKNPFSTRGLEKFSSVLADLEEMKQKIYQNMGSDQEDSLMVRFGYSNAKDWIPIVVKLRDHEKQDKPNHVGNDDGKDKEAIEQARKLNSKGSIMNVKKNNSMLQTAEDQQGVTQKQRRLNPWQEPPAKPSLLHTSSQLTCLKHILLYPWLRVLFGLEIPKHTVRVVKSGWIGGEDGNKDQVSAILPEHACLIKYLPDAPVNIWIWTKSVDWLQNVGSESRRVLGWTRNHVRLDLECWAGVRKGVGPDPEWG
ncbi:hypothetical protein IFM89_031179 [Coptis chinensis]|uniref:Uncharacterized protein n=1 Tax=Coptis chinensis TaxID=261450 RepID=A0A835MFZ8_9MAGN|nr:hypothetical protein IFM89_031179 [Coptis chinensis]